MMLELTIPGFGLISIQHIVFDFNGTLAIDGSLIDGVEIHLRALSKLYQLHVITGDTYHTAKSELAHSHCHVVALERENQITAKALYLEKLNPEHVIAVGNGRNDEQLLRNAKIGIAILGQDGLAVSALTAADIVVPDIFCALALLRDHRRLTAILRS